MGCNNLILLLVAFKKLGLSDRCRFIFFKLFIQTFIDDLYYHQMVFGLFSLEVRDHHNHLAVGAAPRCYYCWELMLLVLQHNNLYCCCLRIYPKMPMQEKSGFKG